MITDAYGSRVQFQHTAARRRLDLAMGNTPTFKLFQHTAARRRLAAGMPFLINLPMVSTHSRPKAAGCFFWAYRFINQGFNTQPPEGGWQKSKNVDYLLIWFQHTAARRRLGSEKPI